MYFIHLLEMRSYNVSHAIAVRYIKVDYSFFQASISYFKDLPV